ncbi:hypothetical protein FB45DRAFT_1063190 [Roridomyces roridus]|uniref:F-box domain-containing protein n=1 Tax=Roridomyces roridus TaxID=1738132 RepID=A0AAD7FGD4_9AGAR|nr:hypothetical protein FB45DRAFT_1063190 [Roridomyces roridus]
MPESGPQNPPTLEGALKIQQNPVHRLPSEILSEIFAYTVPKDHGCKPRLVACICRRWREVALSTPRLWCNIHLDEEPIHPRSAHPLVLLQLQRSGGLGLSIYFADRYDEPFLLELLLTAADRWQSFDFSLGVGQYGILHSFDSQFPLLKRLTIRHIPYINLGNLARAFPRIEELTVAWRPTPVPANLPWSNLARCTLIGCSSTEVLGILRCAPKMTELCVEKCYGSITPASSDPEPTITSGLRTLKILRCTRGCTQDLSTRLLVPRLQSLSIDDFVDGIASAPLFSSPLLTASSGPLKHLSLIGARLSEPELISLLRLTDTLDRFEISWPSDVHSTALMTALTVIPSKRAPQLLPHLSALSITGGLSCSDHSLFMMLRSRVPRLKHVELYYAGRTVFFDRTLDVLREGGMEISLLFDGPEDPYKTLPPDPYYIILPQDDDDD